MSGLLLAWLAMAVGFVATLLLSERRYQQVKRLPGDDRFDVWEDE